MKLILGICIVLGAVFGGFAAHGGHLQTVWQPFEIIIICGAALGAFVISNPVSVILETLRAVPGLFLGSNFARHDFIDALSLMYALFTKSRKEGLMGIEEDIEDPHESPIFEQYPRLLRHHHIIDFISDYMRLVVSGTMNPYELDMLMEVELATHHEEKSAAAHAVQRAADALPAFGIVAAVLGIVKTMSALGGPLNEIGQLVAAALVGTFLGVLIAYGFVGPVATSMEQRVEQEGKLLACIKSCIIASVQGYSPQIAIEFGRKTMPSDLRPSFMELDEQLRNLRR